MIDPKDSQFISKDFLHTYRNHLLPGPSFARLQLIFFPSQHSKELSSKKYLKRLVLFRIQSITHLHHTLL